MPISAAGSKTPTLHRCAGFTLLELLLVVALIAMVTAGASLALRDSAQARLETEAMRLAALLDAARAQSRTLGIPVRWQPTAQGFIWQGLGTDSANALPTTWLDPTTRAGNSAILLGPEPVIAPASVTLVLATAPDKPIRIATDGVRPFTIQATPERAP